MTRVRLAAWGLEEMIETAELLVSELITNALQYAPGPHGLTVWAVDGFLRCEVTDGADDQPMLRHGGHDDEHGRGLHVLDELACCWGSESTPTGKAVWFELPIHAPAAA